MIAAPRDLEWIVQRIVALHDPLQIYVFGSHARGDAHQGSDIDLLIVAPSNAPRHHRGRAVAAALSAFPSKFDLLFFTPEEVADALRDETSFLSSVMMSSVLLYERKPRA